ncbi:MAG: lysozyme [Acutalibacteraceae bacterium]
MKTSKEGIDFIKSFEKLRLQAYLCEANKLTIGYGHTRNVKIGQTCTVTEAEQMLADDIAIAEKAVNTIKQELTQNQYDSLVSLCFNIGNENFKTSTLFKKVNADPKDPTIKGEFVRWIYCKKKKSKGLTRRRIEEAKIYFNN